jgi:hypothetical protein
VTSEWREPIRSAEADAEHRNRLLRQTAQAIATALRLGAVSDKDAMARSPWRNRDFEGTGS